MSRVSRITIHEFQLLLNAAQKSHLAKDEPIPELLRDHLSQVEGCLNSPFQTFSGSDLYRGFIGKATILFYLLIKNHPLQNGNKRMAILTLAYFYNKNKRKLNISSEQLYEMAIRVAKSNNKNETMNFIVGQLSAKLSLPL